MPALTRVTTLPDLPATITVESSEDSVWVVTLTRTEKRTLNDQILLSLRRHASIRARRRY